MSTTIVPTAALRGIDNPQLISPTQAWLAAKKPNTREAYLGDMKAWLNFCAQRALDPLLAGKADADLFGAWLQDPGAQPRPLAAASAARRMAAVSSWYRYLTACAVHDRNPFAAAERPTADRDYSATPWLSEAQARDLLAAACRRMGTHRLRDIAIVRLLVQLGLRVSEVARLETGQLGYSEQQHTLTVHGKGGKRVRRALPDSAAQALAAYLALRAHHEETEADALTGRVFVSANGNPIDRVAIYRIVTRLARAAGIAVEVTPHGLRHTFATIATANGVELDELQDAMGHADPRTTRRYQRAARRLERDPAHTVSAALG